MFEKIGFYQSYNHKNLPCPSRPTIVLSLSTLYASQRHKTTRLYNFLYLDGTAIDGGFVAT